MLSHPRNKNVSIHRSRRAPASPSIGRNMGQKKGEVMNDVARSAVLGLMGAVTPFIWQQSAALDATEPSDNSAGLETIIVTAQKREERLQDVPMSVTALSGSVLDNLQARDFADYA